MENVYFKTRKETECEHRYKFNGFGIVSYDKLRINGAELQRSRTTA